MERSTRYVILIPLRGLDANSVSKAFANTIKGFPGDIRRSLTYDQGKEMAEHLQLTMGTDFTLVNNEQLKRAQDLLNDRPRRVLNWKKPDEVLADVLH